MSDDTKVISIPPKIEPRHNSQPNGVGHAGQSQQSQQSQQSHQLNIIFPNVLQGWSDLKQVNRDHMANNINIIIDFWIR